MLAHSTRNTDTDSPKAYTAEHGQRTVGFSPFRGEPGLSVFVGWVR